MGTQWVGGRGSEDNIGRGRGKGSGWGEDWGDGWGYEEGYRENKQGSRELSVYIDVRDWWIGYYRGPNHHYVCILPLIVIRWKRFRDDEIGDAPNDASDEPEID